MRSDQTLGLKKMMIKKFEVEIIKIFNLAIALLCGIILGICLHIRLGGSRVYTNTEIIVLEVDGKGYERLPESDDNYDLLVLIRDQLNAPEALTEVRRASVKLKKEGIFQTIAKARKNN